MYVVVVSLLIVAPIVCGGYTNVFGPCFVVQYLVSFLVYNHLTWEERVGCLKLLLMSCDC